MNEPTCAICGDTQDGPGPATLCDVTIRGNHFFRANPRMKPWIEVCRECADALLRLGLGTVE